jgi:uncharacterized membrane protein
MDTEELGTELTDQDRILLVFDYLGPLALGSLVATRKEFVKWHAKQGILLSVTVVVAYLALRALHAMIAGWLWGVVGRLIWAGAYLSALGALVLIFLCIVRALEGERFKIPILGDLVDRI